jgi:transcriptional regulator with AAA-type ATPase domain
MDSTAARRVGRDRPPLVTGSAAHHVVPHGTTRRVTWCAGEPRRWFRGAPHAAAGEPLRQESGLPRNARASPSAAVLWYAWSMGGDEKEGTDRTVSGSAAHHSRRRPRRIKLRVLNGPQAGAEYALDRKHVRVGRSRTADVTIEDESVSGQHFDLRITAEGIEVTDLGSTNGTSLFGRRIRSVFILPGDVVLAGACSIQLVGVDEIAVDEVDELRDDGLVGGSEVMREIFATIDKLGNTPLSVLVTGEMGTGKSLVAQAIHRRSSRRGRPFVVLDGAALTTALADPLLYGCAKGANPDADEDRPGVFEQADGGTVFIDEIGEIPRSHQLKILRVISRGEVIRVGEHRPRPVSMRVLASTVRDLRSMIQLGAFREDLYFRLAQSVVELPPLRERGDDVEHLARVFLERLKSRDGVPRALAPDTLAALRCHPWPGNVRELAIVMERAAALCEGGVIQPNHLALDRGAGPRDVRLAEVMRAGSYVAMHLEFDRLILPRILEEAGSLRQAAKVLRIGRKKLTSRLVDLGLG